MKFDEHLVLEFIVRFELLVLNGRFTWALQASTYSSKSLNISFFLSHHVAH